MEEKIRIADLPQEAQNYLLDVVNRVQAELRDVVAATETATELCSAVTRTRIAALEREMAPIFASMTAAGTPVACSKGCGCCCTITIEVSPDEVFALIRHLEATLNAEALTRLKERALAANRRGYGLHALARHRQRIACPVQDPETMSCLGHAARPTPCQGYLSLDLPSCQADHLNPPGRIPRPVIGGILTDIVRGVRSDVLASSGAPPQLLELTAALVAAWADPDAEQRWLAGERVLTNAESPG